ncbi:uncharacterized protein [Palaemon carinicauda]|uniref:uncharacterized protein n=1 Tax=Palaemon carinicauda TaxID=392227 RepID=UPI0035B5ABD9
MLNCWNRKRIKLLYPVLNIRERLVEGRLRKLIDTPEQQFIFIKGKSIVYANFIVRQVLEKYLEGNRKIYMCFVDVEKMYDKVIRSLAYLVFEEEKSAGKIEEGCTKKEVRRRVKKTCRKWSEITGVGLDKKMPSKIKMKNYKTIIMPEQLHGAETCRLMTKEEGLLQRTEMRMVRWIAGISLLERGKSQGIRRMCSMCNVKDKAMKLV